MCTGAEIPAAMAAAAAGTAGTAGAGAAAAEGAAATGGALASALAGGTEAGLLSESMPALAGTQALTAAAPELVSPSLEGLGGMEALSGGAAPGVTSSSVGAAGEAANPLSIGLGNFQNSTMGQYLGKGGDALGNYSKAQAAMGGNSKSSSTSSAARPPSMGQPAQNVAKTPFGGHQGLLSSSAKKKIMQRMGLLGGM